MFSIFSFMSQEHHRRAIAKSEWVRALQENASMAREAEWAEYREGMRRAEANPQPASCNTAAPSHPQH